jgi:hypothetical protein
MTLSGEIRYRPEGFRIKGTDTAPTVVDNYLLQRYLFGADVHMGPRARVFVEVQSAVVNGRLGGPRPRDQDLLDLHQGFVEWTPQGHQPRRFSLRLGRQEMAIGSSRLISASPSLNAKRSFDGVRLGFAHGAWDLEGAAASLTPLFTGMFDDRLEGDIRFWGAAASRASFRHDPVRGRMTFYYLGLENSDMQYAQGRGKDLRHTFGLSWRGARGPVDVNWDVIYQAGRFEGASARAWGVSTETGYRFARAGWRPRVSLRFNSGSGDKDANDPRMQAFNPLFPGGSYAGMLGLFGPTNMTDLTPALTIAPHPRLVIGVERPWNWRTSTADGLYNTEMQVLIRPAAGQGRFVGGTAGVFATSQITRHLQLTGAIIRLRSGTFLKTTVAGNGAGLYSVTALYRF